MANIGLLVRRTNLQAVLWVETLYALLRRKLRCTPGAGCDMATPRGRRPASTGSHCDNYGVMTHTIPPPRARTARGTCTRFPVLGLFAMAVGAAAAPPALAFNYHELEVYGYRTAAKGELEVENATTHTARGSRVPADGNEELTRTSMELTYGLTNHLEISGYGDFNHARGGSGLGFAGQRYHLRASFFEKGQLPVDLGAYVEYELPKHDEDTRELEIRGILEKDFGKWTLDVNPIVEKVLKGANTSRGLELSYAAALIYRMNETVEPRLEMFGDFGFINHFDPKDEQIHLISPAVTYSPTPTFHILGGVAFGLTKASERTLVRLRLEKEFYF
jgi:hypothetical protein